MRWLTDRINLWVLGLAFLIAAGLIMLLLVVIFISPPPEQPQVGRALTVFPAPSPTPTQPPIPPTLTPTEPAMVGGIAAGMFVKVAGTEGVGLRLRESPGTSGALRFIGMDEELFHVKDGPSEANGLVWWFLEAPYDPSRSGWAAADYLTVVQEVQPTPTP
jgi:hypothetical protein